MRWRQIGLRAAVRFAGLNSLRRFAARRDLWREINSQDQNASAFGRASDSNLPMAIAAEKAHLRTAEQPGKARSQDVARWCVTKAGTSRLVLAGRAASR